MGSGTVHYGDFPVGQNNGVKGIRVGAAGAENRFISSVRGLGGKIFHKRGFSGAGAALDNVNAPFAVGDIAFVKEGTEAFAGVRAQKIF